MDSAVRLFFQEVADLSCSERERLFAERQIDPELRAEIESLLSFDSTSDHSITGIVNAAKAALEFDHHGGVIHWGSYRRIADSANSPCGVCQLSNPL